MGGEAGIRPQGSAALHAGERAPDHGERSEPEGSVRQRPALEAHRHIPPAVLAQEGGQGSVLERHGRRGAEAVPQREAVRHQGEGPHHGRVQVGEREAFIPPYPGLPERPCLGRRKEAGNAVHRRIGHRGQRVLESRHEGHVRGRGAARDGARILHGLRDGVHRRGGDRQEQAAGPALQGHEMVRRQLSDYRQGGIRKHPGQVDRGDRRACGPSQERHRRGEELPVKAFRLLPRGIRPIPAGPAKAVHILRLWQQS